MARVAGIDLPKAKRVDIALRYVYGVGPARSIQILEATGIDGATRVKDLTEGDISKINTEITRQFRVEGDLRREVQGNIRRLIEINSYRGFRHRRNLPVHGQRTKSNARTRRGRRRTVGSVKPTE
ncbi:MAG: 30S ribosomal protein S13 [Elusimicrobia bacterium]|nr:30S ribosomal protein S13 [Elusimicrobiota bacterium]